MSDDQEAKEKGSEPARTNEQRAEPAPSLSTETLIAALGSYLVATRDREEMRRAINRWTHDVERAGLQPEQLLKQFKDVLLGLRPNHQVVEYHDRLADRRELILMCIEEYFRD